MSGVTEEAFESHIVDSLVSAGGYQSVKVGNVGVEPRDFDPALGIDTAELFAFIGDTQGDEWEKVRKTHGSPEAAQKAFLERLVKELKSRSTVDVLRRGVVYAGVEKAEDRVDVWPAIIRVEPCARRPVCGKQIDSHTPASVSTRIGRNN